MGTSYRLQPVTDPEGPRPVAVCVGLALTWFVPGLVVLTVMALNTGIAVNSFLPVAIRKRRRIKTSWKRSLFLLSALCLSLAASGAPESRPETFSGRFVLGRNEVVVFAGAANTVAAQQNAQLETLLTLAFAQQNIRFRNLAWEGDTVYGQRREMNFGSWEQQLARVGATVVFAQFGQVELLESQASLSRFLQAYEKLLDQFSRQTARIVLLSPMPFEKAPAPLPDLSLRNDDLRLFAEAIGGLARKRGFFFVDLFTPFRGPSNGGLRLTEDGLHLGPRGFWDMAVETRRQLGFTKGMRRVQADPATGRLQPNDFERLRELIQSKNQLWFDYWRPMNWAFLNGDRTQQPSSRDHRNPAIRWFPEEMGKFLPLIEAKEKEIAKLTSTLAK